MAHDVFISYSSKDSNTATTVCSALERNNIRCWIASRDVTPGKEWGEEIIDAISISKVMIVIFSAAANNSQQVLREVERAVNKNVIIIPFRIENIFPTKSMEYFLYSTHWLDALTPDLEHHIERLTSTVSKLLKEPITTADLRKEEHNKAERSKPFLNKRVILIGGIILMILSFLLGSYFGLFSRSIVRRGISNQDYKNGQEETEGIYNNDKHKEPNKTGEQLTLEKTPTLKISPDKGIEKSVQNDEDQDKMIKENRMMELKIGDYIQFGRYDGKPIDWQVINIDKDGAWLFTTQVLCQKAFSAAESGVVHQMKSGERKADDCKYDEDIIKRYTMEQIREMRGSNNWAKSSLREWLNSSDVTVNYTSKIPNVSAVGTDAAYDKEPGFLYNFNKKELQMIKPISHKDILPILDKDTAEGGTQLLPYLVKKSVHDFLAEYQRAYYKTITDKVFLLSIEEVADYILDRGWELQHDYWWFRTPDATTSFRVLANYKSGFVTHYSAYGDRGVRPALVLNSTKVSATGDGTKDKPYILKN